MGIRDYPISPRSPSENGLAERLIESIPRDRLGHVVVFDEQRLRHGSILLSPKKDAPIPRETHRVGRMLALPILGALVEWCGDETIAFGSSAHPLPKVHVSTPASPAPDDSGFVRREISVEDLRRGRRRQ